MDTGNYAYQKWNTELYKRSKTCSHNEILKTIWYWTTNPITFRTCWLYMYYYQSSRSWVQSLYWVMTIQQEWKINDIVDITCNNNQQISHQIMDMRITDDKMITRGNLVEKNHQKSVGREKKDMKTTLILCHLRHVRIDEKPF